MTKDELLRIIDFANNMRSLNSQKTQLTEIDARWNIISFAMSQHLEGKQLTITSAASASGVPYATAMRRVVELIDEKLLNKRARTKTGLSFSLHPSRKLIKEFEFYATQLKTHIGKTFGLTGEDDSHHEFFFGGDYMTAKILSFPSAMREGIGYNQSIHILCPDDPTFKTLESQPHILKELVGGKIKITCIPLNDLYNEILENHRRKKSIYDLICFDLPWVGEMSQKGILQPLDDTIAKARYKTSDFHISAWKGSRYNKKQYGIPIQPTTELLFYRTDLFANVGLDAPKSTDDVLLAARTLHKSTSGLSGIIMNYGPGLPVAHSFIQAMADFGQPIINLKNINGEFEVDPNDGEIFRPKILSGAGHMAAEYLMSLIDFAHPESLQCDWNKRIRLFAEGHAAMTYEWSVRVGAFEFNDQMPAHDNVDCVSHPSSPGGKSISPIGGFSLGIPTGMSNDRTMQSWRLMDYLTSPELMKWYVLQGNVSSPRFSTSADPEVQNHSKLIGYIDSLERRGNVQIWPRPPIPEINDILHILGIEIHRMLKREINIHDALQRCQNQVDTIMRNNGRY